jgi:hypothetical protein
MLRKESRRNEAVLEENTIFEALNVIEHGHRDCTRWYATIAEKFRSVIPWVGKV